MLEETLFLQDKESQHPFFVMTRPSQEIGIPEKGIPFPAD